jgi:hypothetical protein
LLGPIHRRCELRFAGRPVVDLSLCELCNFPGGTQVFGAPDSGAVPFATPTGPQQSRGSVTYDVIDRPAIAEWPCKFPTLPVAPAGQEKSTLRRADKYRDPRLAHLRIHWRERNVLRCDCGTVIAIASTSTNIPDHASSLIFKNVCSAAELLRHFQLKPSCGDVAGLISSATRKGYFQ